MRLGPVALIAAVLLEAPGRTAPPALESPGGQNGSCSTPVDCYTPARTSQCPRVRFGWGDCPGSRKACDWCLDANRNVFAYSPRGSTYTLESGCNQPGPNLIWTTSDPQMARRMVAAGGACVSDGRGGLVCSNVDPASFSQQTLGQCGNQGQSHASQDTFTYFYVNGINTPRSSSNGNWRGSYHSERDTVAINLVGDPTITDPHVPTATGPLQTIKVGTELDQMYGPDTNNPSGQDPWGDSAWISQNCTASPTSWNAPFCGLISFINGLRSGDLLHFPLTPGDFWECARQAVNLPN